MMGRTDWHPNRTGQASHSEARPNVAEKDWAGRAGRGSCLLARAGGWDAHEVPINQCHHSPGLNSPQWMVGWWAGGVATAPQRVWANR